MAKIFSGLTGSARASMLRITGSSWKGIPHIRTYTKYSNPNTASQQFYRAKFARASTFASLFNPGTLLPYMSTFQRGRSAYNWFIKTNLSEFTDNPDFKNVLITSGSIPRPQRLSVSIFPAVDFARLFYEEDEYYRDKTNLWVTGRIYNPATQIVYSCDFDITYDPPGPIVWHQPFSTGQFYKVWLFFYRRYPNGVIYDISDSFAKGVST